MKFPQHDYEDSGLPECYLKNYCPLQMKELRFFVILYYPLYILTFQKTRILKKELFQPGRQTTQGCFYCRFISQHLGCVCPRCSVTFGSFSEPFYWDHPQSEICREFGTGSQNLREYGRSLFRCACASRHAKFRWGYMRTLCKKAKETETRKRVCCW
jgi:hypothetical protein